jgi:hypothetical protein
MLLKLWNAEQHDTVPDLNGTVECNTLAFKGKGRCCEWSMFEGFDDWFKKMR